MMDSVQHTASLDAGKIFSSTHPGQLEGSLKNTHSFKFTSTLQYSAPGILLRSLYVKRSLHLLMSPIAGPGEA